MNLMNRIIDRNSRILSAQRGYVRRYGLMTLLFGLGLIVFAIISYPQFINAPFFPWSFAAAGCLGTIYGILTLRHKGQYPDPNEPRP
ncbi:MAG: hypothetical protein WCB27_10440 [Thermoguttaceae bacterium]